MSPEEEERHSHCPEAGEQSCLVVLLAAPFRRQHRCLAVFPERSAAWEGPGPTTITHACVVSTGTEVINIISLNSPQPATTSAKNPKPSKTQRCPVLPVFWDYETERVRKPEEPGFKLRPLECPQNRERLLQPRKYKHKLKASEETLVLCETECDTKKGPSGFCGGRRLGRERPVGRADPGTEGSPPAHHCSPVFPRVFVLSKYSLFFFFFATAVYDFYSHFTPRERYWMLFILKSPGPGQSLVLLRWLSSLQEAAGPQWA